MVNAIQCDPNFKNVKRLIHMKTYVLALASMFCLAIVSCKKDNQPDKGEESKPKYAVQFNFNEFTLSEGDFGGRKIEGNTQTAKDTLSKYVGYLYYLVYDSNEQLIRKILQNASNPGFGLIKDSLPQGTYTVCVLATKDSVTVQNIFPCPECVLFDLPGTDAFYKKSIFNVDGEVKETINLSRIVAKLRINIRDKMPYNADSLTVLPQAYPGEPNLPMGQVGHYNGFDLRYGTYFISTGNQYVYSSYTQQIPEAFRNTSDNWFDYYILAASAAKIKVRFSVKDNNGNVLGAKNVLDVTIEPNKRTVLYGNLFDDLAADTSGVGVILDPVWGDSTKIDF
jgi:hypothetical protein